MPRRVLKWFASFGLALGAAVSHSQVITDTKVYPVPTAPAMGAAGSKITDPVFGIQILRVTDGSLGDTGCTVAYSNVPAFNADNTRFYVRCSPNSRALIYDLNATDFTATGRQAYVGAPSGTLQYWSLWSGVNPDVLFVPQANAIYSYNVVSKMFTVSTSASSVLGAGETFDWQMSRSADDQVFANKFLSNGVQAGYLAWRVSSTGARTVLLKVSITGVNEVQVDKSGRYLSVVMDTNGPDNRIWDLSVSPPTFQKTTAMFWHYDSGSGTLFSAYNTRTLGYRSLARPDGVVKMLPDNTWSYLNQQDHFSMQADNELWALNSRYRIGSSSITGPWCVNNVCAFDEEVTQVATDGSQRVRRLFHHHSIFPAGGYQQAPMANISRNGQFVAFTSNWGNASGRLDVYLAKIPPAPVEKRAPLPPRNLMLK